MSSVIVSEMLEGELHGVLSVSEKIDQIQRHAVAIAPWKGFPYRPYVQFAIAYNAKAIFLKFFVVEKHMQASVTEINGKVWEDSCVEFFISFDGQGYYNIECNCIGTIYAAFGKSRMERNKIPASLIESIQTKRAVQTQGFLQQWEVTLVLPLTLFAYHNIRSLKGRTCRANFYKCGDLLPEPHFLSWTNIETDEPDFHVPQFFGTLQFE